MSLEGSVTGVNRARPPAPLKASSRPRGSGAAGLSLAALCYYSPQCHHPSTCWEVEGRLFLQGNICIMHVANFNIVINHTHKNPLIQNEFFLKLFCIFS